jgi:hypothetical protein
MMVILIYQRLSDMTYGEFWKWNYHLLCKEKGVWHILVVLRLSSRVYNSYKNVFISPINYCTSSNYSLHDILIIFCLNQLVKTSMQWKRILWPKYAEKKQLVKISCSENEFYDRNIQKKTISENFMQWNCLGPQIHENIMQWIIHETE